MNGRVIRRANNLSSGYIFTSHDEQRDTGRSHALSYAPAAKMMRHFLRSGRLAFGSARSSQYKRAMGSKAKGPILLPEDRLIEEEMAPGYRAEQFLQVHPGDVLNGKYEVLVKLGYGRYSTVWLTKDRSR